MKPDEYPLLRLLQNRWVSLEAITSGKVRISYGCSPCVTVRAVGSKKKILVSTRNETLAPCTHFLKFTKGRTNWIISMVLEWIYKQLSTHDCVLLFRPPFSPQLQPTLRSTRSPKKPSPFLFPETGEASSILKHLVLTTFNFPFVLSQLTNIYTLQKWTYLNALDDICHPWYHSPILSVQIQIVWFLQWTVVRRRTFQGAVMISLGREGSALLFQLGGRILCFLSQGLACVKGLSLAVYVQSLFGDQMVSNPDSFISPIYFETPIRITDLTVPAFHKFIHRTSQVAITLKSAQCSARREQLLEKITLDCIQLPVYQWKRSSSTEEIQGKFDPRRSRGL